MIVRMKEIDLNFKDPEPESEELTANRVADILTRQRTGWFWAMQQRNVQRLWGVVVRERRSLPAQANETEGSAQGKRKLAEDKSD